MRDSFLLASADLAEGQFKEACAPGPEGPLDLVLTRQQGQVHAYHNVCPHLGRALNFAPDRFLTDDQGHLMCAHHGATFNACSGECVAGPCAGDALTAVAVQERDQRIELLKSPD